MTTRSMLGTALVLAVAAAPAAFAQRPAPMAGSRDSMRHEMPGMDGPGRREVRVTMAGPGMGMMKGGIASMLLGQTAALKLSDQQVTRLAALARSAEAQQSAMRAQMDSTHRAMRAQMRSGGGMPAMPADMEARMKAMHDQMHANVRDALAVLTPDQLATAWEEMHGMGGMGPMGGMHMMMRGMGEGMGAGMHDDMHDGMQREERVIIQRP